MLEFLQFIVVLGLGFLIGYCVFLYVFHKSEIIHLLEIMKEDITNLTIKLNKK